MARYGMFKYGDGTLYGATSPALTHNLWTFIVDWTGDGTFSGFSGTFNNEAMRMTNLNITRGRDNLLGSSQKDFELMRPGQATAILDNLDRRYDPFNAASPLYPYVEPGKLVQIKVKDGTAGTNYGVLYGIITDIQPLLIAGQLHVRIVVGDGLQWLFDHQFLVDLKSSTAKTTIVESILTGVDWPWTVSADDSALMAETYYYWWAWKSPALTELQEIAKTEAGVVFHGRDGTLYLYSRDFTHNRSQAVTEDLILRDVIVPYPWGNVRNEIQVSNYIKSLGNEDQPPAANNLVWSIDAATTSWIPIPNGATITVDSPFEYGGLDKFAVANERIIYFVYDNGNEIQANCPATWESPVSQGTRFYVTNNAGVDGTLKSAAWYGDIIQVPYVSTRKAEDATSQAAYGRQVLNIGGFWRINMVEAQDIADWLLAELKDPLLNGIVIQFENRPGYQFYLDLYDRVQLTLDTYDITGNFRVGKIEHQWLSPNGVAVRTAMYLEPYLTPFAS